MATVEKYKNHASVNTDEKTENLILYISEKLKDSPYFGSVVLNKALYYIDNTAYIKFGKPLSSFSYVKQERGATPNPSQFMPLRSKLISENKIHMEESESFGRIRKKLINIVKPEIAHFSAQEMELIDDILEYCRHLNASQMSNMSHSEISWQIANNLEELPFYTYLLTQDDLEESDIAWAQEIIKA